MSNHFAHKVALITGASRGIGAAAARLLAAQGCNLALVSRDEARSNQLKNEIESSHGVRVNLYFADVTNHDALVRAIESASHDFSAIDFAIINAAIGQYGPVHLSPWEHIERVLRVNVDGAVATAHAITPSMVQRRSGTIVFISSVLGKRSVQYNATYCASKYALHGFADALRLEVCDANVHVSVVCPARTATDFFANMLYSVPQTQRRRVPVAPPERVAKAILTAIRWRRREVVVSAGGKLYASVGYHFPRLFDFLLHILVPKHQAGA